MSREVGKAFAAVGERLAVLAIDDERLRLELRALGEKLVAAADRAIVERERAAAERREREAAAAAEAEHAAVRAAVSSDGNGFQPAPPPIKGPTPSPNESAPALAEQAPQLGDNERLVDPRQYHAADEAELPLIERRARLKAEASRWQITREQLVADGADYATEIVPQDQDIIERARAMPDCFLWMCHPKTPSPPDPSVWEDAAGCFDTLASAAAHMNQVIDSTGSDPATLENALNLLAEAQSALRMAVAAIGYGWDPDQKKAYNWLRGISQERRIFIQRHMRVDDPADYTAWPALDVRIEAADAAFDQVRRVEKQREERLKRVRYHLKQVREGRGGEHDWRVLAQTCDELVSRGMAPSSRELRNLLLPVVDEMPDMEDLPDGFRLVLRELDHYLAARSATVGGPSSAEPAAAEPTPEVREAARLLRGQSLLLIGGEARPGAQQAMEKAFDLKECIWMEAKEHQSLSTFEPQVANPDVEVVVLAIRWSSHSFGDVKQYCDQHGKPLVRLPAGYNPNQVALQIVQQCSEQLQEKA